MAITNYYVRATNGVDVAGQGTTHATAYQTPQFALDDIGATHGRNAVDGDQINICASALEGANVLAASLTQATYGIPALGAPLILRGYTAVANDGGVGEIDSGGFTMWAAAYNYTHMIHIEDHTFGNNNGIVLGQNCAVLQVEAHKGASAPAAKRAISLATNSIAHGCYVHDYDTSGIVVGSYGHICNCYADGCSLWGNGVAVSVLGNIVYGANAGITVDNGTDLVNGNIVYALAGSVGFGIKFNTANVRNGVATNNILVNFSGVGGAGIEAQSRPISMMGYNAFYNCTANVVNATKVRLDLTAHDVALAADPFVNAAGGNFALTDAAKLLLRSEGWPSSYLGASTDPHITIGVVQYGDAPVACDYPLPEDVENGIVYGSGAYTGTLVCPAGGRTCYRWPDYVPCRRP